MQLGAAAGAARADVELKGGAGLMLFVSPRSTTASRTATTPAMPPCSGLKVGQLGLGLGQGGAGGSRSHLSGRCSPRCSPRCIPWCTCHPTAMLTRSHLSSRVWQGRSREPHVQVNLRLVPALGPPLLPLAPGAGWGCPAPDKWGRQACRHVCQGWSVTSPRVCHQPSCRCLGSICWVPAPPCPQPQGTISTRLALAVDTKGFCSGTCWQRRGLSWSTVVSGVSLLPSPACLHPPLSSIPLQV